MLGLGSNREVMATKREGFSRAMLTTSFTLLEQSASARARARPGGWGLAFGRLAQDEAGGKFARRSRRCSLPRWHSLQNTRTNPNFVFPSEISNVEVKP